MSQREELGGTWGMFPTSACCGRHGSEPGEAASLGISAPGVQQISVQCGLHSQPSWLGFLSLTQACAVLFNLLFILCANDPFAAIMTNLSPCRGSAVKTSKDSLQVQPAESLPIFMEAQG